jgi:AraC-like DNA-binding protein
MSTAASADRGTSGESQQATPYTRRAIADRDEAEQVIAELYLPNRLDLSGSPAPLDMEVRGLRLGGLTAGRLTYGREVRLSTADAECFHVNIPVHGRATSRMGTAEPVTAAPGEAVVFSPGAPAEMSWSVDCEQLCLMIPRACLEGELELLLGRPVGGRLTFDFAAATDTPSVRRWKTALELLLDELHHPTDVSRNAHVGRHLEALVLDGLLLGHRHSHSDKALKDCPVPMGTAVRRAVAYLEERPAEPWTTVRLAAEVHLSVRALQEGFRRDLATPPMTYLRQTRLRRARAALQAADRDATTVRGVAASLGILHPSRFAAAYREAFGESPSETLRRRS